MILISVNVLFAVISVADRRPYSGNQQTWKNINNHENDKHCRLYDSGLQRTICT